MGIIEEGYNVNDISEAISQAKIKQAVSQNQEPQSVQEYGQANQELQQSVMETSQKAKEQAVPAPSQSPAPQQMQQQTQQQQNTPEPFQQYPMQSQSLPEVQLQQYQPQQAPQQMQQIPQAIQQEYQQYYPQYDAQQYNYQNVSSDSISEIAEQVISEKLATLKDKIESATDMKTTFEAKVSSLDERLKRIEKIIDRLQLSVLQKVGDYVTNVEDIKKELTETQKSFKTLLNQK